MLWSFIGNRYKCQNLVVFSFKDLSEVHDHVGLNGQKKEMLKGLLRSDVGQFGEQKMSLGSRIKQLS
ncbi:hypothetical protein Hdeb2414_s0020g00556271 [Helianthus debilis subsp. tardiflorus]